jgi:hypothetical protein
MADVIDRHFVVLTPKEGNSGKVLAMSHHVKCCGLSLTLRDHPVFNSKAAARVRVWPACNIASSKNSLHTCFKSGIPDDSALDGNPRSYCKVNSGADTDTSNNKVSIEDAVDGAF